MTAFVTGKEHGKEARATEVEKSKWIADITECLKTYDMLGLWRDAEDVLRREVVRSFVKKVRSLESRLLRSDLFGRAYTLVL